MSPSPRASRAWRALAGVSRPAVSSSIIITGARLQQPTQATVSRVNRRCGVGVGVGRDPEVAPQLLGDLLRPRHVAGGAVADPHHVASHRRAAELRVEAGRAGDLRRGDLGPLADAPQRLVGQVAVVGLDRLEDRDRRLPAAAEAGHELVDEGQVDRAVRGRDGGGAAALRASRASGGANRTATSSSSDGSG